MAFTFNAPGLAGFRCVPCDQLPDFGIYLEQMLNVVNDALRDIISEPITSPMINNYIKNRALPPAVKKRYYREHICRVIVTAILKQVFSVQQIARIFAVLEEACAFEQSYALFCTEFESTLKDDSGSGCASVATEAAGPALQLIALAARAAALQIRTQKYLAAFD